MVNDVTVLTTVASFSICQVMCSRCTVRVTLQISDQHFNSLISMYNEWYGDLTSYKARWPTDNVLAWQMAEGHESQVGSRWKYSSLTWGAVVIHSQVDLHSGRDVLVELGAN